MRPGWYHRGVGEERSEDKCKWSERGKSLGIDNLNPSLLEAMIKTTHRVNRENNMMKLRNNRTRIYKTWRSWMGGV